MEDSQKPFLHFSREEFAGRRARVLAEMQKRGLDALLLFRQESMYYLTGFDSFGYVFFQCLLLRAGGEMTLLTRAPDLRQARQTSVIEDIRIWKDAPGARPALQLREIAREGGGSRFGVEWDSHGITAKNGMELAGAFSDTVLEDASAIVSELRAVKSESELHYVRRAAELAGEAMNAAVELAKPGAFEGDILAAMQGAVFRGGGDYSGNEFILGSGARALLCRSFSGRRNLSPDDQLTVEFAGVYRRYHAAMMKTILVGKPSPRHREMQKVCEEAREKCREALRPGRALGEVFSAYAKTADAAGMKRHRFNATGYSLGAAFAPTWMDWPMICEGSEFVARPNMVFFVHIILMDSENNAAMSTGETLLTTKTAAQSLTAPF